MQNYLIIGIKIVCIMLFLFGLTLITGRRKIGELPVFDFLAIITLGSIIGTIIAEPKANYIHGAFGILLIILLQYLYSIIIVKNRKVGSFLTFDPIVVIENGQIVKGALGKIRYSLDNMLMMLREHGVFDLNEVEFAIVESNGKLSVLKKSQFLPVTAKEIKINTEYKGLSIPVILEGVIQKENLDKMKLGTDWLMSELKKKNISSERDVFFASINTEGTLYISKGLSDNKSIHDIKN